MADLTRMQWGRLLGAGRGPKCGHSACTQHFIDTGSRECVEVPRRDRTFAWLFIVAAIALAVLALWRGGGR